MYRLKNGDPEGYQRDLKPMKLRSINEYLSDYANSFPNSILVSFDEEGKRKIDWKADARQGGMTIESGWIKIPPFYCFAEIIDGQHRLYGYRDFTEMRQFENQLAPRRKRDRLIVVAIPDPAQNERPALYLAINSTQTKISTRQIWALMGESRPETKMRFISNIVRDLNEKGVFEDEIEIPRVTRGPRT